MLDYVEALAVTVLSHWPYVRCFRCLGPELALTEKDTRDAAQALLGRSAFTVQRRACASCQRVEDLLVVKQPPEVRRR